MESARDALWRRFRATGLFLLDKSYSLSLDLNQKKLIEYIINNYLDAKTDKSSEDDYYSYVRSIDSNLLKYRQEPQFADQTKLEKIAGLLTWDEIKNELKNCDDPKKTDGTIGPIKEIKKSLRYEFIIAVAITKKFINTKVNSNCQTDSFGWPIGHAPGQINRNISGADIECFEESLNFIVEPSLGQSEAWQLKEGINLDAHLKRFIELEDKPAKGFFISPSIKERVKTLENFFAYESGEFIMRNFTTDDLISRLENEESLLSSFNNKT